MSCLELSVSFDILRCLGFARSKWLEVRGGFIVCWCHEVLRRSFFVLMRLVFDVVFVCIAEVSRELCYCRHRCVRRSDGDLPCRCGYEVEEDLLFVGVTRYD